MSRPPARRLVGKRSAESLFRHVRLERTQHQGLLGFRRQAADRRANPRDDIITQLLAPTVDGEPLTDLEFDNFFTLLVAAGNDTTRYTMTHGMHTLMRHPQLWQAWKANPELTPTAVEEILRASAVTIPWPQPDLSSSTDPESNSVVITSRTS